MVQSALTTRTAITTDRSSRNGARVTSIGHHHAASTSLEGTLSQFQPGGREVSPNYCISGRDIVLVVPEEYRAWTSSDAWADGQSITYEIINSTGDPDWRFAADTIASVVALDIDICRRYGITPKWGLPGLWQHKNLYQWFGRSYATACAGPSFPQEYIVTAVSMGLAGTAGGGTAPIGKDNDMTFERVVNPADGWLHFKDELGTERVANYMSTDMGNDEVVSGLNLLFGEQQGGIAKGSPEHRRYDVAMAIASRRVAAFRKSLVADVVTALKPLIDAVKSPEIPQDVLDASFERALSNLQIPIELSEEQMQEFAEYVQNEEDRREAARLAQVTDA